LQKDDWLYPLAAIFGSSVGTALLLAIIVEVTGRVVLLIPAAIKKIKEEAKEEEREDQRKRRAEAYRRFGVEVDGVRMLPDTPEVEEFLSGTSEKS
jgi:uncharacterized protein (DUF58 family)